MVIHWNLILRAAFVTAVLWARVDRAAAESVYIPNFSFEGPDVPDGEVFNSAQPNYPFHDPSDDRFPGTTGPYGIVPGTGHGLQVVLLRGSLGGQTTLDSPGSLLTVAEDSRYTLTVAVGSTLLFEPGEVRISLLVNGGEVATTLVDSFTPGTFVDHTASFTTGGLEDPSIGKNLRIRLSHIAGSSLDINEIAFDNVRLERQLLSVPEPSTLALLGTVTIYAFRRRVRRR